MSEVVKRTLPKDEPATFTSTRVFAADATPVTAKVETPVSDALSANATKDTLAFDWIDEVLLVNETLTIAYPRIDENTLQPGA